MPQALPVCCRVGRFVLFQFDKDENAAHLGEPNTINGSILINCSHMNFTDCLSFMYHPTVRSKAIVGCNPKMCAIALNLGGQTISIIRCFATLFDFDDLYIFIRRTTATGCISSSISSNDAKVLTLMFSESPQALDSSLESPPSDGVLFHASSPMTFSLSSVSGRATFFV